ncbi:MAG TPA: glycosyltransferase family 39 protein [Chloroflexia bacterium]|jgi:4-amino-4-deoxy-L-arabinose transferase-like glycosyltransferase
MAAPAAPAVVAATGTRRRDLLNIGLMGAVFIVMVLLVPPVRDFPMDDDWVYAQSVRGLLDGNFQLSTWSQAIALGHITWAALFAYFLGFSFTTLSLANLSVSLFGLVLFYLLLRQLNINPNYALFGVAALGFNPMYVYLSYSFMTDISFIAFMLAALLCFVIAFKVPQVREGWLWWGSVVCALAYLNRQFGALIPVAVLLYMWLAREWRWRRMLAVTLIPVVVAVGYAAWVRTQPPQLVEMSVEQMRAFAFQNPGSAMLLRAFDIVYTIAIPGLCLLPLLFLRGRTRYSLFAFCLLAALQVYVLRVTGTVLPVMGNVVDHTGFFTTYQALWPEWVWAALAITGSLTLCLLTGSIVTGIRLDAIRGALRGTPPGGSPVARDPAHIAYLLLVLLVPVTLFLPTVLFDRYFLPMFPLLTIAVLRYLQQHVSASPSWWRWALLVPMSLFSMLGIRDLYEFYDLR